MERAGLQHTGTKTRRSLCAELGIDLLHPAFPPYEIRIEASTRSALVTLSRAKKSMSPVGEGSVRCLDVTERGAQTFDELFACYDGQGRFVEVSANRLVRTAETLGEEDL